jgi:hypothetical protein
MSTLTTRLLVFGAHLPSFENARHVAPAECELFVNIFDISPISSRDK